MWYFPLSHYSDRILYKNFAQNITSAWYQTQPDIFPNKFTGYHAAVDLEVLPGDIQPIAIHALGDGKILYAGPVSGYGGLILERLSAEPFTALYGHVRTTEVQVGESVTAGQVIATLGTAFSAQTGGERQHLHLGLYKGTDLYFKGYEPTLAAINSRWLNPTDFLASHQALDPNPTPIPTSTPTIPPSPKLGEGVGGEVKANVWTKILLFLRHLFRIT